MLEPPASAPRLFSFFVVRASPVIYTLSLHDALPICRLVRIVQDAAGHHGSDSTHSGWRSEEHTSELQSLRHLVCRLLLEKKKADLILAILDRLAVIAFQLMNQRPAFLAQDGFRVRGY